ncbi:hypothetical protein GQ44DRAFT_774013 [Phaeosphaeriaceae sp. PMI808]|nr:hypothetical protein GQ44DRAFT_774013 [Phaeosphaeriaceae sp. PMI808]
MGKYTFSWEHAATEVLVTGTFDDWQKTVTLEKEDGVFKKTVELPKVHTQYKFVVDGNWVINETARKEDDGHGIVNNVLQPEDIVDEPVSTLSSAAPESTTAALAGAVPKESDKTKSQDSLVPGAFPMIPPVETPSSEPKTFDVNPIPATEGLGNPITLAPGEPVPHPSTLTSNTIASTVSHETADKEPEAQAFGVAPIPATIGAGNPIHLAPGEKVPDPSTLTAHTVQSTVNTDAASYSKSDALPALPDLGLTPQAEREANGGMFSLPPVLGGVIPESSLPMGVDAKTEQDTGVTIQSAAPTSTTAALAGEVPKETRAVPEIVSESRKEAGFAPEAISNPIAVLDKKEVEQELKDEVPEVPAAADNSFVSQISSNANAAAATVAAGAVAGAGLFAAATYDAKEKAAEATGLNGNLNGSTTGDVPAIVSESQNAAHVSPEASANPEAVSEKKDVEQELLSEIPKTTEADAPAPAIAIPAVVSESQKEAHVSPEAAANSEAVSEKKAVESELLKEIPTTNEAGDPAPVLTAATSTTAPGTTTTETAPNIPDVVAESQKEAHVKPEAAASVEAVGEKKAVEAELLGEATKTDAAGESAPVVAAESSKTDGLNAPASAPAQPASSKPIDANTNVSFAAKETKPAVTTGTETTTTEATSAAAPAATTEASSSALETPRKENRKDSDVSPKGTPGSQSIASGVEDKKKKRRSIFGKIKDKLSSKN